MFIGETYKHTNFLHCEIAERHYKFVCLDIMCRYWPYFQNIAELLDYMFPDLKNTNPFLSRMHAMLHTWYCKVSKNVLLN